MEEWFAFKSHLPAKRLCGAGKKPSAFVLRTGRRAHLSFCGPSGYVLLTPRFSGVATSGWAQETVSTVSSLVSPIPVR